jgi:hypothetical protein
MIRKAYATSGEWARWSTHVSEPGQRFPMRTWALVRTCISGDQLVVARGCGPSEAACKRAAGISYRAIRKATM